MVKDSYHGNRKKEKGLTVIETVVSLTVITIISIGALTLAIFAANSRRRADVSRYFSNLADQSLKLYQTYEGSNFNQAFSLLTGEAITYENDVTYYLTNDYTYTSDTDYSYVVSYDFEEDSLKVTASYKDGDLIVERSTSRWKRDVVLL